MAKKETKEQKEQRIEEERKKETLKLVEVKDYNKESEEEDKKEEEKKKIIDPVVKEKTLLDVCDILRSMSRKDQLILEELRILNKKLK